MTQVSKDGTPCLNILSTEWTPAHSIFSVLASLQSLLMDPTPADPANEDAAKIFMADKVRYSYLVRECARKSIDKGIPSKLLGCFANI